MPNINSIPYANAEGLNKYLYDNFYSTETINSTATLTGFLRYKIFEMSLETGVTATSICQTNYNYCYFNPLYAEAVWKMYMNEMTDCFAFFGFKESTSEPTFDMTESHAGFMIYEGKLYGSVADGNDQQRVEVIGIDCTRVQEYKIEYNRFYIKPLPVAESQLGLPKYPTTFPGIIRSWKMFSQLSNYPPKNQVHYIMQYITNIKNNLDKRIIFNRFIYKEVYAD